MEFLEMSAGFLDMSGTLPREPAYYAMQMVDKLCDPGDEFVSVTSSLSTLHIHAVKRADGGLGLMFVNDATGDGYNDAMVTVDVTGLNLESTGQYYEYGWDNYDQGVGPYEQMLTGLTGTFQIRIPDVSVVTLLLAPVQGLAGDYNGNGVIDAADYTVWRDALEVGGTIPNDPTGGVAEPEDFDYWRSHFGDSAGNGAAIAAVPEPAAACMLAIGVVLILRGRRRPVGQSSGLSLLP